MNYLLYNPLSDNNNGEVAKNKFINLYGKRFPGIKPVIFVDLDFEEFSKSIKWDDTVVLSGGDGTINIFANKNAKYPLNCKILFYAGGTGNDFRNDLGKENDIIELNEYLDGLPKVKVLNTEQYFINNVGYGIDGTVCEIADIKKSKGKKVNYSSIAFGLLMHKFKPCNATVTIDGIEHKYTNVWLAPTMNGRYYGGGMMMAPNQDRKSGKITCVVVHDAKRIKTLIAFLSIFKGEHIKKYPKIVDVYECTHVKVTFDRPNAIQIDGETTLGIFTYEAWTEE